MSDSVAAVVLAAGAGRRLLPLTRLRPKPLCPVGDRALLDHALDRVGPVVADPMADLAVNVHHHRDLMVEHLDGRATISVEEPVALGTAGALGRLRSWIAGRSVLVTNADAWLPLEVGEFVSGWDGERIRLLCVEDRRRGDFGPLRYCGVALMPWTEVSSLEAVPTGLYEVSWARARVEGRLELVVHDGQFVDCADPGDYLHANLLWSGGRPVVGEGAEIGAGALLERSVVWPGSVVRPREVLVDAVRADGLTVYVR